MKKITAVLLSISLLLLTTGCLREPPTPTNEPTIIPTTQAGIDPTQEGTATSTQPTVSFNAPLLTFSAPIVTEDYRAEDGAVLFTYTYQEVSLILEDPQIAEAVMIDYLNLIDYENSSAKDILSDAAEAYTGENDWLPYSFTTLFSPARFDESILSLYGTHALYNGSPHSTTANTAVTYDLLTGRQLELKDVLVNDFSADTLCKLICDALSAMESQGMLYSDYAYVISELFTTNRPVESWYFSRNGLCFFFAPYEIAPYSTGTVIAEIPYSELSSLMKDAYFPAETVDLSGTVSLKPFQDVDTEQFSQFAELIMDKDGSKYLLYTDGCLQNVRIAVGSWSDEETFHEEATIFAALTLSAGDALMLQFSSNIPQSLCLTYEDNGQTVYIDLTGYITDN